MNDAVKQARAIEMMNEARAAMATLAAAQTDDELRERLREMKAGGDGGDAPASPFAAATDDELRAAMQRIATTNIEGIDGDRALALHGEAADLCVELERRLFPQGIDYTAPAMMPVADIDATRPRTLLRCAGESGAVLTSGEVCLLSGAGGVGKSTAALQVAFALASGDESACGLTFTDADHDDRPTGAPVVYASAEDAAWAIKRSARRMASRRGDGDLPRHLHHVDLCGCVLFAPAGTAYNEPPTVTADWRALWNYVAAVKARLVVIDPVMAVYAGNENRAVEVRMFVSALVKAAREHNCGVLLLAHSTKAARGRDADPFDAGHVAGSASWTDGVRGALTMDWPRDDDEVGGDDDRVLRVLKANYGRVRIAAHLSPRREDETAGRIAIVGFDAGAWLAVSRRRGKTNGDGRRGKRGKAGIDDDLPTPAEVA